MIEGSFARTKTSLSDSFLPVRYNPWLVKDMCKSRLLLNYAPINVKPLGGEPGIGGGFGSSHRPVVGTFDRFNGFSSIILLTFCCYFDNPQMPAYARPPPPAA